MGEIRLDIDRDTVEGHPALQPDPDRRDLVLESRSLIGPLDPNSNAVLAALAADVEGGEGADNPLLQRGDIGAHIWSALLEVKHHIHDPLAGAVIRDLTAAPALKYRKSRLQEVAGLAAGAGRVERGMLQQPDQFGCIPGRDVGDA